MTALFPDTSPEAEEILLEGYRRMSAEEKLQRLVDLHRVARRLALTRIREWYGPDLSDREERLRLAALRLDRKTMMDLFDWDPEVEGY